MSGSLDYFVGGVPAGAIFQLNINSLSELMKQTNDSRIDRWAFEIYFIALISYFEAFCKDHFASLLNICPTLVDNLKQNGQNVTIGADDIVIHGSEIVRKLGFILVEKYDFGDARKINSLYIALLSITPFSKEEKKKYDNILADRNLIVHHGGAYTRKYVEQRFNKGLIDKRIYMDSLVISETKFEKALSTLKNISVKLINSSKKALEEHLKSLGISHDDKLKEAVNFLNWWD